LWLTVEPSFLTGPCREPYSGDRAHQCGTHQRCCTRAPLSAWHSVSAQELCEMEEHLLLCALLQERLTNCDDFVNHVRVCLSGLHVSLPTGGIGHGAACLHCAKRIGVDACMLATVGTADSEAEGVSAARAREYIEAVEGVSNRETKSESMIAAQLAPSLCSIRALKTEPRYARLCAARVNLGLLQRSVASP
jgi:hypothetical protein